MVQSNLLRREAKEGRIWEYGESKLGLGTLPARGLGPPRGDDRYISPEFREESGLGAISLEMTNI